MPPVTRTPIGPSCLRAAVTAAHPAPAAVSIVLGGRKATTAYLQQRLAIGYMRAADLLDRMEREGILGAPVYNGARPILINGPSSREV